MVTLMLKNKLPVLAISSCLMGEKVRYDANDAYNTFVSNLPTNAIKIIPFCPECMIGLTIPRPPIQLIKDTDEIIAKNSINNDIDIASSLRSAAQKFMKNNKHVNGIIFKSKSPSCGVNTSKLFDTNGNILTRNSSGIFAQAVQDHFPYLPVVDDKCLTDSKILIGFFVHVYILNKFKNTPYSAITKNGQDAYKKILNRYFIDKQIKTEKTEAIFKCDMTKYYFDSEYTSSLMSALAYVLKYDENMIIDLFPDCYKKANDVVHTANNFIN